MGMVMYAGVDYEAILRQAEEEADVVIWDGGNNDFPFFAPDLLIVVADPLRPGHELLYHPGETNLRMADVVVINKVDSAEAHNVEQVLENIESVNPMATVIFAKSPPTLDAGPDLLGKRVLVVDDGPTLTHGGMPFGAGPRRRTKRRAPRRSSTRGRSPSARSKTSFASWPQLDERAAGDGLRRGAAPRARGDDQRDGLRRRRDRHADRPRPPDHVATPDPPRAVRARGGRLADARGRARSRSWRTAKTAHPETVVDGVIAMTTVHADHDATSTSRGSPISTPERLTELLELAETLKDDPSRRYDDALRGEIDRLHLREAVDPDTRLVRGGSRTARRHADRAHPAGATARTRRVDRRHGPLALRLLSTRS